MIVFLEFRRSKWSKSAEQISSDPLIRSHILTSDFEVEQWSCVPQTLCGKAGTVVDIRKLLFG